MGKLELSARELELLSSYVVDDVYDQVVVQQAGAQPEELAALERRGLIREHVALGYVLTHAGIDELDVRAVGR